MKKLVAGLSPLLLALVASGCGALGAADPRPRAEAPALPDAFAAQTASAPAAAETDAAWWRTLGADELDALVTEALEGNFSLRAAVERVARAAAEADRAGVGRRPQVSAGLSAARSRQVFVGLPIPGSTGVLSSTSTRFGLSLDVAWELDLWGRLSALERAASLELDASSADYAAARLSLAGQVAKAWVAAVEASAQVDVAATAVDVRRRSLELVEDRFAGGLAPRIEVEQQRAELAGAEALLAARRRAHVATVRQLEVLLGRYPSGALVVGADLPAPPERPPVGLPATLVARRPDLFAAERRLAAAGAQFDSARADRYPRLSLTASGGTVSDDLSDLLDGDFRVWSLAGNLVQPIFQGGRIRAAIALADARAAEAAASFADAVLRACAEVEIALDGDDDLGSQVAFLATAVASARRAETLVDERYRAGLVSLLDVLVAQRTRLEAESGWLAARRDWLENRIDLHLALGGGFESATGGEDAE